MSKKQYNNIPKSKSYKQNYKAWKSHLKNHITQADIIYKEHLLWKKAGCPRLPQYDNHIRAWLKHQNLCTNCRKNPCAPNCAVYKPTKLKTNWTLEAAKDLKAMATIWNQSNNAYFQNPAINPLTKRP